MYQLTQEYDQYTPEDFEVWKLLYEHQAVNFPGRAAQAFMDGFKKVKFTEDSIPHFEDTNEILQNATGWVLQVVPGLIPDKDFFELLSVKKFPATAWLRKLNELDYLEAPDMFHDVFAHVPLLTNQYYVDFLQELSKIALEHINNPFAIEMVSRIYWFTIEFGLINEEKGLRIYGAGILSSAGETTFCLTDKATRYPYDVKTILEKHYFKHDFQDRYYVIDSYEQIYSSIDEIKESLAIAMEKYPNVKEDVTKMDIILY